MTLGHSESELTRLYVSMAKSRPLWALALTLIVIMAPSAAAIAGGAAASTQAAVNVTAAGTTCGSSSLFFNGTCSPSWCTVRSTGKGACTAATNSLNHTDILGSMSCQTCTQSTDSRCTSTALAAAFKYYSASGTSRIKAAYCTDKYLIIYSDGLPGHDDQTLQSIAREPGCTYRSEAGVTHYNQEQSVLVKIPLSWSLVSSSTSQWTAFPSGTNLSTADMPQAGAVAVALNGVPIFPVYNNQGIASWESCELDRCNAHAGLGGDYHYHGDPYGSSVGDCLYHSSDYTGSHPPQIGWALDGPSLYGRYTNTSQEGASVQLDNCGGHVHGSGSLTTYHYHSAAVQSTASKDAVSDGSGKPYIAFNSGPLACFAANISAVDNFFSKTQPNYDNSKPDTGVPYALSGRSDYASIRPCCGSTNYITSSGIRLSLTAGVTVSSGYSSTPGTTTGTTSSSAPGPAPSAPGSSAFTGTWNWTTLNAKSYTCAQKGITPINANLVCGQIEFNITSNSTITYSQGAERGTATCGSGTIQCYVFASVGKVGGSCTGDRFYEDVTYTGEGADLVYAPEAAMSACIGKSSCAFSMIVDKAGTYYLNGASTAIVSRADQKAKILAMCSGAASTSSSTTTNTTSPPPPPPSPPPPPATQPTVVLKLSYATTSVTSWTTTALTSLSTQLAAKMTVGGVAPSVTSTAAPAVRRRLQAGSAITSTAVFPTGTSTGTLNSASSAATSGASTLAVTGITEVPTISVTATSGTSTSTTPSSSDATTLRGNAPAVVLLAVACFALLL